MPPCDTLATKALSASEKESAATTAEAEKINKPVVTEKEKTNYEISSENLFHGGRNSEFSFDHRLPKKDGGAERVRTDDPHNATRSFVS
jgi:hypothetical protein